MIKNLSAHTAARLLFALMLTAVLGLALYPNLRLPELAPSGKHTDFVYHTIAFVVLTGSAMLALARNLPVVAFMAGLAIGLELLQAFVPGRGVFLIDAVASLFGVLLGALLTILAYWLWRRCAQASWHLG